MAQQGWYSDPSGQPGMYRYWDGQSWSEALSPTPLSGPPPGLSSAGSTAWESGSPQPTRKKSAAGWILAVVGVVVVALVLWLVISGGSRDRDDVDLPSPGATDPDTDPPLDPTDHPTGEVCPRNSVNERAEHPHDDRVYGGDLSYPRLGSPWSNESTSEIRLPFGRDVALQKITIHEGYQPGRSWMASLIVGELYAGDGFFEPELASQIVNQCIFGAFYHDAMVIADTLRSEPYSVDGFDGWITETNLSFSIEGLPSTSELAIVIIIRSSAMSSSIFYASIPNDAMQYKPDIDRAIADLRVHT